VIGNVTPTLTGARRQSWATAFGLLLIVSGLVCVVAAPAARLWRIELPSSLSGY